jgi:hypothetical protein
VLEQLIQEVKAAKRLLIFNFTRPQLFSVGVFYASSDTILKKIDTVLL